MANWNETAAEAPRPRDGIVAEINGLREQLESVTHQLDIFDRIVRGQPRHDTVPSNAKVSEVPPAGLADNLSACRNIAGTIYSRLQVNNEQF